MTRQHHVQWLYLSWHAILGWNTKNPDQNMLCCARNATKNKSGKIAPYDGDAAQVCRIWHHISGVVLFYDQIRKTRPKTILLREKSTKKGSKQKNQLKKRKISPYCAITHVHTTIALIITSYFTSGHKKRDQKTFYPVRKQEKNITNSKIPEKRQKTTAK